MSLLYLHPRYYFNNFQLPNPKEFVMSNFRFKSVEEAAARKAVKVDLPENRVDNYYAEKVFNRQRMFEYLPDRKSVV